VQRNSIGKNIVPDLLRLCHNNCSNKSLYVSLMHSNQGLVNIIRFILGFEQAFEILVY
jgi:hypothetical protein